MLNDRKRQKSQNQNHHVIKQMLKAFIQDMITPIDKKKINWFLNGLMILFLLALIVGRIT